MSERRVVRWSGDAEDTLRVVAISAHGILVLHGHSPSCCPPFDDPSDKTVTEEADSALSSNATMVGHELSIMGRSQVFLDNPAPLEATTPLDGQSAFPHLWLHNVSITTFWNPFNGCRYL